MSLAGRHVVLGVAGGVASYKSCYLARRLTEAGARVDVILTRGGAEFVRPPVFEALTGRPVVESLWESGRALDHIRLAREADLVIVAPATAHLLARAALGLADDFLTTLLLARTGPVLIAPAMNDDMFSHPATVANLATLRERGWFVVGPETGALAEGPSDRPGRMSEPEVIRAHAVRAMATGSLRGLRVLVTAGPTREAMDPVRTITNRSSGMMGFALAEAAWGRGAEVELVSGPSFLSDPEGVQVTRVESTSEMAAAVARHIGGADVTIMAAAPADYRPANPSSTKTSRGDGAVQILLEPTPDILQDTRDKRKKGSLTAGFALETGAAMDRAREKMERKGLDLIVFNDVLEAGAGLETGTNRVTVLFPEGGQRDIPLQSKREVADALLDVIEERLAR